LLRTPILVAIALTIAFAGGVVSSLKAIEASDPFDVLAIGPWQANPRAQTASANPYEKARRARAGGFALGQAEGLVFAAATDSAGSPLDGRCAYRLDGQTPASRLWVLRLAGPDDRTLPSEETFPASIHSNGVLRRADGSFSLRLDATARSGNWIRLDHEGRFLIEMTLFDTPAAGNFGLVDLAMPQIERGNCRDA
jgi:hypothetical protein